MAPFLGLLGLRNVGQLVVVEFQMNEESEQVLDFDVLQLSPSFLEGPTCPIAIRIRAGHQ